LKKIYKGYQDHPIIVAIINIVVSILTSLFFVEFEVFDAERSILSSIIILFSLMLIQAIAAIYSIKHNQELIISNSYIDRELGELDFDLDIKKQIFELIRSSKECIKTYNTRNNSGIDAIFYGKTLKEISRCVDSINTIEAGAVHELSSTESDKMWKKMISKIENNFFTTNFPIYSGLLGKSTDSSLLDLQKKTINSIRGRFVRLFVYEDEKELSDLNDVMKMQREIGVKVGVISLFKFNEISTENFSVDKITQRDFSVIDQEYLYLTSLDATGKKVSKVELTTDSLKLKEAISFSESLCDAADFTD